MSKLATSSTKIYCGCPANPEAALNADEHCWVACIGCIWCWRRQSCCHYLNMIGTVLIGCRLSFGSCCGCSDVCAAVAGNKQVQASVLFQAITRCVCFHWRHKSAIAAKELSCLRQESSFAAMALLCLQWNVRTTQLPWTPGRLRWVAFLCGKWNCRLVDGLR